MSREVKYIGMDVHKEATVIAVQSYGGKLVMESIVETKTSSILQFIHGLLVSCPRNKQLKSTRSRLRCGRLRCEPGDPNSR